MNKEGFIKAAVSSGYGSKEAAVRYIEQHQKDEYTVQDFIELYHQSMRWKGCKSDKGLRPVYGINGRTTAMSNGIAGNSGGRQDWG